MFLVDEEDDTVPTAAVPHYIRCARPGQIRGMAENVREGNFHGGVANLLVE